MIQEHSLMMAVLAENGIRVPRDVSRTSSVVLFGKGGSKYSVGSKLKSGAIIKEVKEEDWKLKKTDAKYKFFMCKLCKKDVRGDNRKTHTCK